MYKCTYIHMRVHAYTYIPSHATLAYLTDQTEFDQTNLQ